MSNTINFCPECGNFLYPKVINGYLRNNCPNCGYHEETKSTVVYSKNLKAPLTSLDGANNVDELPFTKSVKCPKCGGDQIKFFQVVDPNIMNSKGKSVMDEAAAAAAMAMAKGKSVMMEEDPAFIPLFNTEARCITPPSTLGFICCKYACYHRWEDLARV
ncbi:hypothetical protein R1flu_012148 [Riccia fluitans]|uniref:DNA-directed RNA polymerase II subunit RPB9-like zinc ribbon domain-containing protein n=1 Tax=Riccia fluitans TaxID=41844 RepID=A0ABD1Z9U3_9MARC